MKNQMSKKTGKMKRHDFTFGKYFNPQKNPRMWFDTVLKEWHFTKHFFEKREGVLVYDNSKHIGRNGKSIPAKRIATGYIPQSK